jgi:hypothetical protein
MIKEVTYKWHFEDGPFFEKFEIIDLGEGVVLRKEPGTESCLSAESVAITKEGFYVYLEDIFRIRMEEHAVEAFDLKELQGLSAMGLLIRLRKLASEVEAS